MTNHHYESILPLSKLINFLKFFPSVNQGLQCVPRGFFFWVSFNTKRERILIIATTLHVIVIVIILLHLSPQPNLLLSGIFNQISVAWVKSNIYIYIYIIVMDTNFWKEKGNSIFPPQVYYWSDICDKYPCHRYIGYFMCMHIYLFVWKLKTGFWGITLWSLFKRLEPFWIGPMT